MIIGPSQSWICGCVLAHGVFMIMYPTLLGCVLWRDWISWVMCLRARSWGFAIRCFLVLAGVLVGNPTMTMSTFKARFVLMLFCVMSVGSSGNRLSQCWVAVRGSCVGYCVWSCVSRCCAMVYASGFVSDHV